LIIALTLFSVTAHTFNHKKVAKSNLKLSKKALAKSSSKKHLAMKKSHHRQDEGEEGEEGEEENK